MSDNKIAWGGAGIYPSKDDNENNLKLTQSFSDIMSEDLARHLQPKEKDNNVKSVVKDGLPKVECKIDFRADDTSSDLFIAQLIQQDLDREHDQQVNRNAKHVNKNSNVAISYDSYKACPSWYDDDSEDEVSELSDENRVLDSFEEREISDPVIHPCGYSKVDDKIITKHDSKISGRKNAERVMNFPPEVNTGDGGGFDMLLSNKVYNELKISRNKLKSKQMTKEKGDTATSELALDRCTRVLLLKLKNNNILKGISGPIAVGKESVVIHATGGVYEETELSPHCAIKVYKTLSDFKTREQYLKCDAKYKNKIPRNNSKKAIKLWAKKEFHNLFCMRKVGIQCPTPYLIKDNVIVMSFIGTEYRPAPKLRHADLSFADWCIAYEQVIEVIKKLYNECNLIHGDLSEYNILWHDEKCWLIDVGQSVVPKTIDSFLFLLRDCKQIGRFFESKGIPNVPSDIDLFNSITGFEIQIEKGIDIHHQIEKKIDKYMGNKSKELSDDNFEFLWNEAQKAKGVEDTL